MDINRNQYFMAGLIVLILGIQLRVVDSFKLNAETTQIVASASPVGESGAANSFAATVRKEIRPPEWSGWMLISIGSVLILHSLAMKRPD